MTNRLGLDGFKLLTTCGLFLVMITNSVVGVGVGSVYIVAAYVCSAVVLRRGKSSPTRAIDHEMVAAVALFFASATLVVNIQKLAFGSMEDFLGRDAYGMACDHLLISFVYLGLGVTIALPEKHSHRKGSLLGAVLLCAILFWSGVGFIDYQVLSQNLSRHIDHLSLGDPAIILIFLLVACARQFQKYVVACVGLLAIFFIQSRTVFFIGFVVIAWRLMLMAPRLGMRWGFLLVFILSMAYLLGGAEDEKVSRMLFASEEMQAGSFFKRLEQFDIGVSSLSDQMAIGNINFPIEQFGSLGSYMHNILSYWQQYGVFVFLSFLAIVYLMIRRVHRDYKYLQVCASSSAEARVMIAAYAILAVLFSRSYTFYWMWFAVGLYCTRRASVLAMAKGT